MFKHFLWPIAAVLAFSLALYLAISRGYVLGSIVIGVFWLAQISFLGVAVYLWRRGAAE